MTFKKLVRKFQKLLFREQWSLLVCNPDGTILKHIKPPKDRIWADPFPVEHDGHYYIFIEQQFKRMNGTLGFIELFPDLSHSPFVSVLEKPYHLSWPNVFPVTHDGKTEWYMIPETHEHGSIDLYRAESFPDKWCLYRTLFTDIEAVDTAILEDKGKWWLFTSTATEGGGLNETLSLFSSDTFTDGPWEPHPANPVVRSAGNSRMAGNFFRSDEGDLFRPTQNCAKDYGRSVLMERVTRLDPDFYCEEPASEIFPERNLHAVCTHTWNQSGAYLIRDIKTRRFRPWS